MPQRTMDDILDVIEPIQDLIQRAIKSPPSKALLDLVEANNLVQELITELSQGARDRAKRRRQRARAKEARLAGEVSLFEGASDGE